MKDPKPVDARRRFLLGGMAAAAVQTGVPRAAEKDKPATMPTMMDFVAPRLDAVRFGVIGVGQRGSTLLRLLLQIPGAKVKAICDVDPASLAGARKIMEDYPQASAIASVAGDELAYREMLNRSDVDAVIIATPWRWHAPMAIETMQAGKHAFVEVPMATTLDDLWQMVEVSEGTRQHCMMMENVCYGRDEMMVLNLVEQGVLGELTHAEGAYIHDLRWQMREIERGTGSWRTAYHTRMRGNIYPTHGLGPVAQYMGINRGDRFDYLTSMSSPSLGRAAYARREFPDDHTRNAARYVKGDMNSTLLKTVKGRSILVQYDTTTARPYSRLNLVQGTNGAFAGFPNRIAVESVPEPVLKMYETEYEAELASWRQSDQSQPEPRRRSFHEWDEQMERWYEHFDHPLWKQIRTEAEAAGGHGGMDFVMLWRIVQCLREGIALDQNVYDGAAWSSLFPLTHASVTARSERVDVPDFTRGQWRSSSS